MRPSDLTSTGDAIAFVEENMEYMLAIEEHIDVLFKHNASDDFFLNVLLIMASYRRVITPLPIKINNK